jgi:hypothetical protein
MTLSKVTAKNDPPKSTRREHIETQILEGVRYELQSLAATKNSPLTYLSYGSVLAGAITYD